MEREQPIELSLEAGPGDFRFRVDGVNINVCIRPSPPIAVAQPVLTLPAAPAVLAWEAAGPEDELYFRQVAQELYASLGKLAKEINLSIQSLSLAEIINTGLVSPGEHLDQARTQVNDVLQMTEQATLNILGLVEHIQEDCQVVQSQLATLEQGPLGTTAAVTQPRLLGPDWTRLLVVGEDLDRTLRAAGEGAKTAAAPAPLHFPLGEVLQTVLEFCSNDTVKQHLKPVLTQHAGLFRQPEAEAALSRLASQALVEDGLHQLPVEEVLSILTEYAGDQRVRDLCKKMSSSAGKIFPMPLLPLEGHPGEPGDETQEVSHGPAWLGLWEDFFQGVKDLAAAAPSSRDDSEISGGDTGDEAFLVHEAQASMGRINTALSRITEHLSFQDLSGQRLQKVQTLLCQLQVHVLTILVRAGNKLKIFAKPGDGPMPATAIKAQEGLDRLLSSFLAPDTEADSPNLAAEQPLDQDAVNEILTSMGF